MINRPTLGTQRPPPRSLPSGGSVRAHNRPALPSKLSSVQSVPPIDVFVDLTCHVDTKSVEDVGKRNTPQPLSNHSAAEDGNSDSGLRVCTHEKSQDTVALSAQATAHGEHNIGQDRGPLPFPARPLSISKSLAAPRTPDNDGRDAKRDPGRIAHGLEAPASATRLPYSKIADFFPWDGSHPEDVLNEHVIKSGYGDKPPPSNQIETYTARPSLWPNLKNRSGLQTLSALFAQAIEKRQKLGRCTAQSTFRPPPRITVPDTKREAWLRDLANPAVPLRKQSRNIPHGIRGKVLMEQCLSKNIPIARAVWLAKCVGANELRQSKRKGISGATAASGELKWIREWTGFVEQFLDGVITECGQDGWQSRMQYAIRLSVYFFAEHLLDEDHFADWLLTSLESSALERLPIWLLFSQMYWKPLVSRRRRGRRLAAALLAQLDSTLQRPTITVSADIAERLQQLIMILSVSHRGCLLVPSIWDKYKHVLQSISEKADNSACVAAITNLAQRNRLLDTRLRYLNEQRNSELRLLDVLDSIKLDFHVEDLASRCLAIVPNFVQLIDCLLKWASSLYREGLPRVYVAVRLLQQYKESGIDIDQAIYVFLRGAEESTDLDHSLYRKVIAEIVRSRRFSVGRLLQWSIANGSLSQSKNSTEDVQLLTALPLKGWPQHLLNLRKSILQDHGVSVDDEAAQLQFIDSERGQGLSRLSSIIALIKRFSEPLAQLKAATRFAIADAIGEAVTDLQKEDSTNARDGSTAITVDLFCALRDVLEQTEDYTVLSDLLRVAVSSNDPRVLASVCDTLNYRAEIFAAVTDLRLVFENVYYRHRILRQQQPLVREFLVSLASLASRMANTEEVTKAIASDLSVCEQQNALAVCSPASDNMMASNYPELFDDEDIDRILASGTNMDEQTMARVFSLITERLSKVSVIVDDSSASRCASWLSQLRSFDNVTFDRLVQSLLSVLLASGRNREFLQRVMQSLVSAGSITLAFFLEAAISRTGESKRKQPDLAPIAAGIILENVLPAKAHSTGLTSWLEYHLRTEQQVFCETRMTELLRLVKVTLTLPSASLRQGSTKACTLLADTRLLALMRRFAIANYAALAAELELPGQTQSPVTAGNTTFLLNEMIRFARSDDWQTECSTDARVSAIINNATELSLPFHQLQLLQSSRSEQGENCSEHVKPALVQAIIAAIDSQHSLWPEFVRVVDQTVARSVREWAERSLLAAATAFEANPSLSAIDRDRASKLVDVVGVTAASVRTADYLPMIAELNNRFRALAVALTSIDGASAGLGLAVQDVIFWITTLLQLALVYIQSDHEEKTGASELATFCTTLCRLAVLPLLRRQLTIVERLFDVAAMFSDDLTPESLASCARYCDSALPPDPRFTFLFGPATSPDSWLGLAIRPTPPPNAAGSVPSNLQTPSSAVPHGRPSASLPSSNFRSSILHPPPPQPPLSQPQRPSLGKAQQPSSPRAAPTAAAQARAAERQLKIVPFPIRRWEILPDATPVAGENDTSLNLALFGARRV
ncbi:RNA polymerase II mediator complex subunit [Elasticomyces elasticus]|nr:RNA polymerase II mediator complex subunit [Elasticomyces elasticus]